MDANTLTAFSSSVITSELGGVAKALKVMSAKDVQQASEFLDAFLSQVVCKQILARLFSDFGAAFGLNFSFVPSCLLDGATRASAQLDVDVTSEHSNSWQQQSYVYGQQVNSWELDVRLEQKRLLVYVKSKLLADLFSNHFTTFTVKLDFIVPKTQFAGFYEQADLVIPIRIKQQPNFTSMLADLISDGYDLTSLQPFLAS